MDFHSLLRRDLQFLCKRNKIPANMTNVAMADALNSLEIVEGLDEYMNQSDPNAPQSPTSIAKEAPKTATRTTRGKTSTKAEPQSSQLVSRSCRLTSKSLAGEIDQENINKNVAHEQKTKNVKFEANVPKTPAARSTRKASAATSCSSKVQESKKDELVQSVYNTRRSTRLLEKCMADLSLKTKETLENKPSKNEETEQKVSAEGKNPAGSEPEVILGRDLSVSMDQVWDNLKNDNDQVVGGDIAVMDANTETNKEEMKEVTGDIAVTDANTETNTEEMNEVMGDIAVTDANTETNKEEMNEVKGNIAVTDANTETTKEEMNEFTGDDKESENGLVQVDKLEETLQAICEEGPKKNDNDQEIGGLEIHVDLGDIPVAHNDNKESQNVIAFDSLVQVDQQETEETIQGNDSDLLKMSNYDEDNKTESDAGDSEVDNFGVDSDGTISEADSNQAVLGSDIADEEMILSESEGSVAAPTSPPLLEETKVKTTPLSPFAAESISALFPRPSKSTTPLKNSAMKLNNVENKENNMEMMTMMNVNKNENGESIGVEEAKKKKKVTKIAEKELKDASMRQLVKMVKELSIKSSHRTALQILPGNNQTAE